MAPQRTHQQGPDRRETSERVGLVLTAGGARGAYQAGALSVLLPELERRGERPTVYTGVSVGALNAALLAGAAHLGAREQAQIVLAAAATATKPNVLRPLWQQLPLVALRYGAETLAFRLMRLQGFLGTEPLERTLRERIDWSRLHRNIAEGHVATLAVVATVVRSGRVRVFLEGVPPQGPTTDAVDYVPTRLGVRHVLGSAAIPMLFPPSSITEPPAAAGWYVDGSTRLHEPLKPALDLGVDRMVLVGTTGLAPRAASPGDRDAASVDLGDGAVSLLNAMIEDPLRRDVRRLGEVNAMLAGAKRDVAGLQRLRRSIGVPPYRTVPYVVVAPRDPDEIADLALRVYRDNHHGLRGLRDPDFQLLHRLTGSDSPLQGELLSFILFDPDFIDELVRLGHRDALRWLRDHPEDLWDTEPIEPLAPSASADRSDGPPGSANGRAARRG